MFSSVIKDIVGSKAKNVPEMETEDTKESIEELSTIFSTANFPFDAENTENKAMDEDDDQLDIGICLYDCDGENITIYLFNEWSFEMIQVYIELTFFFFKMTSRLTFLGKNRKSRICWQLLIRKNWQASLWPLKVSSNHLDQYEVINSRIPRTFLT